MKQNFPKGRSSPVIKPLTKVFCKAVHSFWDPTLLIVPVTPGGGRAGPGAQLECVLQFVLSMPLLKQWRDQTLCERAVGINFPSLPLSQDPMSCTLNMNEQPSWEQKASAWSEPPGSDDGQDSIRHHTSAVYKWTSPGRVSTKDDSSGLSLSPGPWHCAFCSV